MTNGQPTPAIARLAIAGTAALIGALERVPAALPLLLMRCAVALVFWRSGVTKLPLGILDDLISEFAGDPNAVDIPPEMHEMMGMPMDHMSMSR